MVNYPTAVTYFISKNKANIAFKYKIKNNPLKTRNSFVSTWLKISQTDHLLKRQKCLNGKKASAVTQNDAGYYRALENQMPKSNLCTKFTIHRFKIK